MSERQTPDLSDKHPCLNPKVVHKDEIAPNDYNPNR